MTISGRRHSPATSAARATPRQEPGADRRSGGDYPVARGTVPGQGL